MAANLNKITWGEIQVAAEISDVDKAAKHLQDIAGITDGGIAGQHLPVTRWRYLELNDRRRALIRWLEAEDDATKALANADTWLAFKPGDRVVLIDTVDVFPTIKVAAGETGTIAAAGDEAVYVRLDVHHPELNDWQNQLEVWRHEDTPCPLVRTDDPGPLLLLMEGENHPTSWEDFARENMLGEGERYDVLKSLWRSGEYAGGGGAQPGFRLVRIPEGLSEQERADWIATARYEVERNETLIEIESLTPGEWAEVERDSRATGGVRH